MVAHPRTTMDDITEVSSTEELEKRNTVYISKNHEIRSKTALWIIVGAAIGLVVFVILVNFLPIMICVAAPLGGAVLAPWLMVGRTNDSRRQLHWTRFVNKAKSRDITGQIFFPHSSYPEDVTHTEVKVFI